MKNRMLIQFSRVCTFILAVSLLLAGCGTTQKENVEQGWKPTAPINMIVPYAAGGGLDLLSRTIAEYIDLDGQSMHTTNIEGAGGVIGTMEAYNSEGDGLTLLIQSLEVCIASSVAGTVDVDLGDEMIWVAGLAKDPYVLSVKADSPYNTLEDLLADARENPDTISLAALSTTSTNAAVQDFLQHVGADITYVPYDGDAKARAAVMGGHEDMLYGVWSGIKAYVDSGDFRVLALATEEREKFVPDVPTFQECGLDVKFAVNRCVALPPETDEEIARYYEAKLQKLCENEEFQTIMSETLGCNTEFTGMDGMGEIVTGAVEWAKEYVPLTME